MGIPLVCNYKLHVKYVLSHNLKETYAWITSVKVLQPANTKAVSIGRG